MFYALLTIFAAAVAAVDQWTKVLAQQYLTGTTVTIIPGWLQLHYITNDGMALSLFRGGRWMFVALTAVYLAVVVWAIAKKHIYKKPELWCLAAITGGAIGNLIDRACHRYDLHPVVLDVQRCRHFYYLRRDHPRALYSDQGQRVFGG